MNTLYRLLAGGFLSFMATEPTSYQTPHAAVHFVRSAPVSTAKSPSERLSDRQIGCLSSAIWHEARNQPIEGRIAVAEVVLQRVGSHSFPHSICSVVAQPGQFSFVRSGSIPAVPVEGRAGATKLAKAVVDGKLQSSVRGAMYFHADYVSPGWALRPVGQIGNHIFYR